MFLHLGLALVSVAAAYTLPKAPLSRFRAKASTTSQDVPCCPPFGPSPPAPFPAKYETRWQTQPVDHFNYLEPNTPNGNRTTFQQRYLYYAGHWPGPPAPIVFVPCVEAGPAPYYFGEYGWVVDTLAKNLSALVVFGEHRYFGLSQPLGDAGWFPDSQHLGLMTEAQTLEDDNLLVTELRTNLSAWDSPVIAVGGSLAGEMSTWFRVRYPFNVDMALAGSAPILGFPGLTDPYGWYSVVQHAFEGVGGEECVEHIRTGYWEVAGMTPAQLNAAFDPCTPATLPCHSSQVANLMMDWAGTAAESSYPPNVNSSLVMHTCLAMKGAGSGVEAYQRAYAPIVPGQCLNISFSTQCGASISTPPPSLVKGVGSGHVDGYCVANPNFGGCKDGWSFESCTTEIHPILANNVTDFYPPSGTTYEQDEAGRLAYCQFLYGSDLSIDHWAMPRSWGQLDLARFAASASRIIFSSGEYDPWSAQSINMTLAPTLPFVLIPQGAHHSELLVCGVPCLHNVSFHSLLANLDFLSHTSFPYSNPQVIWVDQ